MYSCNVLLFGVALNRSLGLVFVFVISRIGFGVGGLILVSAGFVGMCGVVVSFGLAFESVCALIGKGMYVGGFGCLGGWFCAGCTYFVRRSCLWH